MAVALLSIVVFSSVTISETKWDFCIFVSKQQNSSIIFGFWQKNKQHNPHVLALEKLCRYLKALLNKISGVLDIATKQQHENIYNKRLKKAKIRQI